MTDSELYHRLKAMGMSFKLADAFAGGEDQDVVAQALSSALTVTLLPLSDAMAQEIAGDDYVTGMTLQEAVDARIAAAG